MEVRDMVRMANQIASFFRGYRHDEAVKETANHINAFWEPRMREQLLAHLEQGRRRPRSPGQGRRREDQEAGAGSGVARNRPSRLATLAPQGEVRLSIPSC